MKISLGELADIFYGESPNRVMSIDGKIPVVGTGGTYGYATRWLYEKGVVVARKGSLGTPRLFESPFWPVDTTYAVVPRKDVDLGWLYYCLLNFDLTKLNEATGVPSINRNWLLRISFKTFEIEHQKKITCILRNIDSAIEKTETLIAKHQQIKIGLMHDLFTRGILPNGQLRPPREQSPDLYQETRIGWLPKEWTPSSCGTTFSIDSGITLGPHRRPNKRPHPYLRVANVRRDEIKLEDVSYIEAFEGESEFALKKNDLLVVEGHASRSEIGRCAIVPNAAEGMLFQNHLFRLRPLLLDTEYSLLWMNSHHAQLYWELQCSTSSGLNTINKTMLRKMPVFIPRQNEQKQIAGLALGIKKRIQSEVVALEKMKNKKIGLMQDLLTGKVPVKVDIPEKAHA